MRIDHLVPTLFIRRDMNILYAVVPNLDENRCSFTSRQGHNMHFSGKQKINLT